jgi:hypothetical protein
VTRDGQRFLIRIPPQSTAQGAAGATAPGINANAQNLAGQQQTQSGQAFVASGLTVIRNWPAVFQKKEVAP